jgi:hypothetical protein
MHTRCCRPLINARIAPLLSPTERSTTWLATCASRPTAKPQLLLLQLLHFRDAVLLPSASQTCKRSK